MPKVRYDINLDLGNYKTIEKAEKILGTLSGEVKRAVEDGLRETAEKMEEKAKSLLNEYKLGGSQVASSLSITETARGIKLEATSDHADYVEFGTGIRGEEDPHPQPDGWSYDINGHGDDGWLYIGKDKKLHWTAGTHSRPFMYKTWRYGSSIIGSQIRKHLNEVIAKEVVKAVL